ncbi:MAG: response regulator [Burkholderiaceae bacterium]
MRVLLIEDDAMIGEAVEHALRRNHWAVDWVRDGEAADTALRTQDYDAVLLDLGLPRRDGLTVLRDLRARGGQSPVLIMTARDAVSDRIDGLDAGADDYLLKPFDVDELLARLRALIRRSAGRAEPAWVFGDLKIDTVNRQVQVAGEPVVLSAREWAVLEPLVARPGQILSRPQLEEKLYGWGEEISSNAVEVYIHKLRRKLGSQAIRNVRGLGYMVPANE